MKFCDAFQFEVPDSFPLSAWEKFLSSGKQETDGKPGVGGEFVLAMGCVAYRYKSCNEAVDSMIASWHESGKNLGFNGYYTMQRDLFAFFTCGLSVVESLIYGIYVVTCQRNPAVLPWSDLNARKRKTDPDNIIATLTKVYPTGHTVINEINNSTVSATTSAGSSVAAGCYENDGNKTERYSLRSCQRVLRRFLHLRDR